MRLKGRIANWNDARGFGFVEPSAGGMRAFVHISSFVNRGRRPVDRDLVMYKLTADAQGRPQAVDVEFMGDPSNASAKSNSASRALVVVSGFMAMLAVAVAAGIYPPYLLLLYLGASSLAFLMYWRDKSAARKASWRTAENSLHAVALLGGWPGALLAMQVFRHKSSKASFRQMFWVTVVVNCGVLLWLASPAGAKALAILAGAM